MRVLVLEDDELNKQLLAKFLRGKGCDIQAVGTVKEALWSAETFRPNVILSDIMLIGETGLDMFVALSHAMQERVVFMTGYAGVKGKELMATGCPVLYKPFDLSDLWSVLLLSAAD